MHGRRQWGAVGGSGGGTWLPWIFIHGTNMVDIGLKVLFFGVCFLFFGLFPLAALEEA